MYGFEAMTLNIHEGYLEAIVRGHRANLLRSSDYNNLCQCETIDDIKMHLFSTEYGPYLQNELPLCTQLPLWRSAPLSWLTNTNICCAKPLNLYQLSRSTSCMGT